MSQAWPLHAWLDPARLPAVAASVVGSMHACTARCVGGPVQVRCAAVGVSQWRQQRYRMLPRGVRWEEDLPAYLRSSHADAAQLPLQMLQCVTASMLDMAGGVQRAGELELVDK